MYINTSLISARYIVAEELLLLRGGETNEPRLSPLVQARRMIHPVAVTEVRSTAR